MRSSITTYQQIRTQYLLLQQQAQQLPFEHDGAVSQSARRPWLPFAAPERVRHDDDLDSTRANTGQGAAAAYARATQRAAVVRRRARAAVRRRGARACRRATTACSSPTAASRTASKPSACCAGTGVHGDHRPQPGRRTRTPTTPSCNTQIAVLNKINATAVTAARLAKDANNVLVSLLEQQLLDATDRREAAVQGINAHIAFLNEAGPLLARTTAETTTALTTFRIP